MPPKLYTDTREMLMEKIGDLAASYTPEWRFNLQDPDMGTALAGMFARVLERSMEECNQAPKLWYRKFMEAAGCEAREAAPAKGYMTFGLVKPDMPEILLTKGWGVVSGGREGSVVMETEEDVYVSSASVSLSASRTDQESGPSLKQEPEDCWLLTFDRPVSRGVITMLFSMNGNWEASGSGLIWEYYGRNGWTFLGVRDGTEGFGHTGIVGFAATSDFTCMDGAGLKGWCVRIRAGEGGKLLPRLPEVFMNAAPVTAREPGTQGNIEPWAKSRLKRAAGFVSVIRNPGSFFGGREKETWEDAAARTAARLRHQFRAVTPGDYERLVLELCPEAEKVRCFTGFDRNGEKQWGAVTVAVLLQDFLEGHSHFFRIRDQLHAYFRDRADGVLEQGRGCGIVLPLFVRMDVRAVICVRSYGDVMGVRAGAEKELERFLHPVKGGYDGNGWDMGMIPDHMQLKNCLQHVPGVFYVRQLTCLCFAEQNGEWQEKEWEQAAFFPWSLPVPGKCLVDVEVG